MIILTFPMFIKLRILIKIAKTLIKSVLFIFKNEAKSHTFSDDHLKKQNI